MPLDPELAAETRAWLVKARRDLDAAAHQLTATPPFAEDAAFHAQQAAEKTLKAFLTWSGSPFGKTHNLERIGEACLAIDPTLRAVVDDAVPLTEYAWRFRYPGEPDEIAPDEAVQALAIARAVFEAVLARLPEPARA